MSDYKAGNVITAAGDRVEYKPIGGAADNVSHSTGEILNVINEGGEPRFVIKNDNTGKETTYQPMNIVKKI
ncbi:hypothetical protein BC834DRAFT_965345 [Gloeopeniophorella convolvens]|nr:hypothetical protein BC834DRAFT_965345 [Gloeopeniophorella convolvens]